VGGTGAVDDDRENRDDRKLPMPAPQVLTAAFVSVATTLKGRAVVFSPLLSLVCDAVLLIETVSASGVLVTDVVLFIERCFSEPRLASGLEVSGTGEGDTPGDADRAAQRPLTPSIALKSPLEPAVIVRVTASRAGASCWSSLSSCIPSLSRKPMSEASDGFSPQGCLI
jgi:hypothetical protein